MKNSITHKLYIYLYQKFVTDVFDFTPSVNKSLQKMET